MYYFCRFRGYMIVVYTNRKCRGLDRLVEYVRETKGNLGYTEDEIRKEAKINTIDLVDDTNTIAQLYEIDKKLIAAKKHFDEEINEQIRKVEKLRRKLREFMEEVGMIDEVEDYY